MRTFPRFTCNDVIVEVVYLGSSAHARPILILPFSSTCTVVTPSSRLIRLGLTFSRSQLTYSKMDEPVTDIVFVSSKDNVPEGYRIVSCSMRANTYIRPVLSASVCILS